jgi:hypothetical protein
MNQTDTMPQASPTVCRMVWSGRVITGKEEKNFSFPFKWQGADSVELFGYVSASSASGPSDPFLEDPGV